MKKIDVTDRTEIKQLLYCQRVLAIRDDSFRAFSGFQLWWYDKQHNVCSSCDSSWLRGARRVCHYSLDKAARILWRRRKSLFMRHRNAQDDSKLIVLSQAG
jgi:hypothetical protein